MRYANRFFALMAVVLLFGCHRTPPAEKALQKEIGLALRRQNYETALSLSRQAVDLAPHEEQNWDHLVHAYFGLHDLGGAKRAIADWRVAVEKPSPKIDEYAGDLALVEGDPAGAIEFWSKVLRINPKQQRVLQKVARAQHQAHNWSDEEKTWSQLIALHESANARVQRALCIRHLHRWDDALNDVHRAEQLAPQDPEVIRAVKLFEHLGKFLAEIREIDARLVLSPSDAGLLADRALLFLHSENPELAIDDAEAAAQLEPTAVRPKLFKALALLALRRPEECAKLGVQTFIRLDALKPEFLEMISRLDAEIAAEQNSAELYVMRAWQLNDIAQPALALQDAEKAAELDSKSGGAHAEASYALMKLGRADEAFAQVKEATDVDPNFPTAWQYRGELEMYRGDYLGAVESLSRALSFNQTATALQRREECYRHLGLLVKADDDHRAIEQLNARGLK